MLALLLCLAPVPDHLDTAPAIYPGYRFTLYECVWEVCWHDERCPNWKPLPGHYCLWNVTQGRWATRTGKACVWSFTPAEIRVAVARASLP